MHRTRTSVAIVAAVLSPLSFALLGLEGTASAGPQDAECAASLVRTVGLSAAKAERVCGGESANSDPDLGDCTASLVRGSGFSPAKAEDVCGGESANG